MLVEDPERKHVPAEPERIAVLYEATNQPVVQPQGRSAQSAQAVVVALGNGAVFEPLVALTLQSGETIVYAGQPVREKDLPQAIEEALNFAESMGFILDATGWANLDESQKLELLGRLPAFRAPGDEDVVLEAEPIREEDPLAAVARLFAAFAVLLCVQLAACSGVSAEQRAQAASIHQQLGDNLLHDGNAQEALKEYLQSLDADETPESHLGAGLIYAWSLGRPADGEREFRRALEMRPDYSEARTNLGALYISRGRYAEAIEPLEKAAKDPLYKARVLAQSNLGWALYKNGQVDKGIGEIRGAMAVAPKYCLGWRQLGSIYEEQGKLEQANDAFQKYAEACPDTPDAFLLSGKVLVRLARAPEAKAAFARCAVPKDDKDKPIAAECARFLKELGSP